MMDITETVGLKIGSTHACASVYDGSGTPQTKVIRSCISYVTDPVTLEVKYMVVGEERPDSHFPLDKGVVERDEDIPPTVAIIEKLEVPKFLRVVAAVPAVEIMRGRDRLRQAITTAITPRKMALFSEVFCGAVNSLTPKNALNMDYLAVNLGSTTTEIMISLHGRIKYLNAFTDLSGNTVDHELHDRIQNVLGKVIITLPEVRLIKENFDLENPKDIKFKVMTRARISEETLSKPIYNVLTNYTYTMADLIKRIMAKNLPHDTVAQVLDNPIILTGGMINIRGLPTTLEQHLQNALNYKVKIKTQPEGHVAPSLGALQIAGDLDWDKVK